MTRLSVNINKVALLRNSRTGNYPDLYQFAKDCESYGAQGITVHPRPDERHIRYSDIPILKDLVTSEYNIEGYPSREFMDLVLSVGPDQVTLVPDPPNVLTSDSGWDTIKDQSFLKEVVSELKNSGIRVSLFLNADWKLVESAANTGTHRIELYTGDFAKEFLENKQRAVLAHTETAKVSAKCNLGVNAGHDLNLDNLGYYKKMVPGLLEVSIGHALITNALYYGIKNTIHLYLNCLA